MFLSVIVAVAAWASAVLGAITHFSDQVTIRLILQSI